MCPEIYLGQCSKSQYKASAALEAVCLMLQVDKYFEGRCSGAARYEPNAHLRQRYPDDVFQCDSASCCGQHHGQQQ